MKCTTKIVSLVILACTASMAATALAVDVRVTIRNLAAADGVALSPVVLGAHDGSVNLFDDGVAASPGVEDVAEMGSTGLTLQSEITTMQSSAVTLAATASSGGFGPGILLPGAVADHVLSLDPTNNRYLSFLSMVVPSNDSFIGNDDPMAVELFDGSGNFVAQDFVVSGGSIWDAGTEVNGLTGPAYVVGATASDSPAENGVVHLGTSASADLSAQFGMFVGEQTPPGTTFNTLPPVNGNLVSFSFAVVPEPASLALCSAGMLTLLLRRASRQCVS